MAPWPEKTIQHFTHPGHSLQQVSSNDRYKCDDCKTDGFGERYRCDLCNFNLHEHCATCPAVLASFIHPGHHLSLVIRKAQPERHKLRVCDVCGDQVEGLFYRCGEGCDFDVHPLCTQLPQTVRHALHPHHPLILQTSVKNCLVCKNAHNSMGYGCSICRVDIHIECIILAAPATHPTPAETSQRLVRPLRPASAFQEPQSQSHMYIPPQHGVHDTYYHPGHYNAHQSQGGEVSHVGRRRRVMFYLVRKLGIGSLTGTVFGASSIAYT